MKFQRPALLLALGLYFPGTTVVLSYTPTCTTSNSRNGGRSNTFGRHQSSSLQASNNNNNNNKYSMYSSSSDDDLPDGVLPQNLARNPQPEPSQRIPYFAMTFPSNTNNSNSNNNHHGYQESPASAQDEEELEWPETIMMANAAAKQAQEQATKEEAEATQVVHNKYPKETTTSQEHEQQQQQPLTTTATNQVPSNEWQTGVAKDSFAAAWQATTGGRFRVAHPKSKERTKENDIPKSQEWQTGVSDHSFAAAWRKTMGDKYLRQVSFSNTNPPSKEWQTGVSDQSFAAAWQATFATRNTVNRDSDKDKDIVIPQSIPMLNDDGDTASSTSTSLPTPNGMDEDSQDPPTSINGDATTTTHRHVPKPPSTPPPPQEAPNGSSPTNYANAWQAVYGRNQPNRNSNNNNNSNTNVERNAESDDTNVEHQQDDQVDEDDFVANTNYDEALDMLDELNNGIDKLKQLEEKLQQQGANDNDYMKELLSSSKQTTDDDELLNGWQQQQQQQDGSFGQAWEMTMGKNNNKYNNEPAADQGFMTANDTTSQPQRRATPPDVNFSDAWQATMGPTTNSMNNNGSDSDNVVGDPAAFAKSVAAELDNDMPRKPRAPKEDGASPFQGRPVRRKPGKYMNRNKFYFSNPETVKEQISASQKGRFDDLLDQAKKVAATAAIGVGVPVSLYVLSSFVGGEKSAVDMDTGAAPRMPQQNQVVDLDQDAIASSKSLDASTSTQPVEPAAPSSLEEPPSLLQDMAPPKTDPAEPVMPSAVVEEPPAVVAPPKSVRPTGKSLKDVLGDGWSGQLQYARPGSKAAAAGAGASQQTPDPQDSSVSTPSKASNDVSPPVANEGPQTAVIPPLPATPLDPDLNVPYAIENVQTQPESQATESNAKQEQANIDSAALSSPASIEQQTAPPAQASPDLPSATEAKDASTEIPEAAPLPEVSGESSQLSETSTQIEPEDAIKGVPELYAPPSKPPDSVNAMAAEIQDSEKDSEDPLASLQATKEQAQANSIEAPTPVTDARSESAVESPAEDQPSITAAIEIPTEAGDSKFAASSGVPELYAPPSSTQDESAAPDALMAKLEESSPVNADIADRTVPLTDPLLSLVRRVNRPVPASYLNNFASRGEAPNDQQTKMSLGAPSSFFQKESSSVETREPSTGASEEDAIVPENAAKDISTEIEQAVAPTTASVMKDSSQNAAGSMAAAAIPQQDLPASVGNAPEASAQSLALPNTPERSVELPTARSSPIEPLKDGKSSAPATDPLTGKTDAPAITNPDVASAPVSKISTVNSPGDAVSSSAAPAAPGMVGGSVTKNSLFQWVEKADQPWASSMSSGNGYASRPLMSDGLNQKLSAIQSPKPAPSKTVPPMPPVEPRFSLESVRKTIKSTQANIGAVQDGVKSLHIGEKLESTKGSVASIQEKIGSFKPGEKLQSAKSGMQSMQERVQSIGMASPWSKPSVSLTQPMPVEPKAELPTSPPLPSSQSEPPTNAASEMQAKPAKEAIPTQPTLPSPSSSSTVAEPQGNAVSAVQADSTEVVESRAPMSSSVEVPEKVTPEQAGVPSNLGQSDKITETPPQDLTPPAVQSPSLTDQIRQDIELAQRGIKSVQETASSVGAEAQETFAKVRSGIDTAKQTANSVGAGAQTTLEGVRSGLESAKTRAVSAKEKIGALTESARSGAESAKSPIDLFSSKMKPVSLTPPTIPSVGKPASSVIDTAVPLIKEQQTVQKEPEQAAATPAPETTAKEIQPSNDVEPVRKAASVRAKMRSVPVPWSAISDSELKVPITEDATPTSIESSEMAPVPDNAEEAAVEEPVAQEVPKQSVALPQTRPSPPKRPSYSLYPKRSSPKASLLSDEQLEKLKSLEEKLSTVQFSSEPVDVFPEVSRTEKWFTSAQPVQNPEGGIERTPVAWTNYASLKRQQVQRQEPQRQPGWFFETDSDQSQSPQYETTLAPVQEADQPVDASFSEDQRQFLPQQQQAPIAQPQPPRHIVPPDNYFPNGNRYY